MFNYGDLSQETKEDLLRKNWYYHDARWFAAVARESGMEVANRLNREAVRALGQVESGRLARALGAGGVSTIDEFLEFFDVGWKLYVAPPLMEMEAHAVDERSYEVTITRCFVAEQTARAGISGTYECAVFDRVEGWHRSLNLPLAEGQVPTTACVRAKGQECRRVLTVASDENRA